MIPTVLVALLGSVAAFSPLKNTLRPPTACSLVPIPVPEPVVVEQQTMAPMVQPASSLDQGIQSFLASPSSVVSLQERKVPTAEEIAQKKLNFNLWLWGGGFVAPFLATIFYFGPKFWTK